ncbi:serine hydrolase domain-containing protein [Myceligenerans pegani]|uniref:Beta-lactamase family protein n=1 Tax=Myceligenerans pegani TaxID=2776917 RepID=A0ABR9MUL1_9MICO|nr:serine hydrolase domain-containing protein [Myceligenerans sp. TRM 65318]MBE1875071.1 beta-lactamase family protein [Myceligenerans sp. TRM 65318]MBE3017342.1 beta-lactamase family protein [Myceligenerans sp. TRM 65318]
MTTTRDLPRSSPEAEGLNPAAVLRLVENLDRLDSVHSFMLLRHGNVVAEGCWTPYDAATPHVMFSVSKSFTSLAVGLAISDGLLGLDDKVLDHFAAEAPDSRSDNLRAMTIRHLLTMSAGHDVSTMEAIVPTNLGLRDADWVRQILAMPVPYEPGSRFVYNTGATYLAGVAVQRRTGRRLLDYLGERVLGPLGFQGATWEQDPDGLDVGGYGMRVRTEDLAKLGQLCLRRGQWDGAQLVPAEWIDAATSRQIDSTHDDWPEWRQGYGYQFWRSRFGAYRADGAFGQYAIVWPEHDVVLAITSGLQNLQSVQDAVWDGLLPTLDPAAAREAGLPPVARGIAPFDGPPFDGAPFDAAESPGAAGETEQPAGGAQGTPAPDGSPRPSSRIVPPDDGVTWDLHLPLPAGGHTGPTTSATGRTYRMGPNSGGLEALELSRDDDGRLVLREEIGGTERTLGLGDGEWVRQRVDLADGPEELACAAAWTATDTLVVRMIAVGTPFAWTLTLRFDGDGDGDRVAASLDQNVSFGETHLLDATGTATEPEAAA